MITRCDAKAKEVIKNKVKEKMDNKYKVEDSKIKMSKMITKGIEIRCMNCGNEELISSIDEQNVFNEMSGDTKSAIVVVRKYQNQHRCNSANLIIRVSDR